MKKLFSSLMIAILLLSFIPIQANAAIATTSNSTSSNAPVESAEANALLLRLNEINTLDKSNLSSVEKRQLRKEVRTIKSQLREVRGGVYLSIGAIIIIVLLLILLL